MVKGPSPTTSRRLESNLRCIGVDIVTAAKRELSSVKQCPVGVRCSPTAVNDAASNVVILFEVNVVVKFVAVHRCRHSNNKVYCITMFSFEM